LTKQLNNSLSRVQARCSLVRGSVRLRLTGDDGPCVAEEKRRRDRNARGEFL
jgi:hypothetical protein